MKHSNAKGGKERKEEVARKPGQRFPIEEAWGKSQRNSQGKLERSKTRS